MRVSNFFISTLKEAPAEAELISHKLMLRAGLIKRLGSGLYTWMPLGLKFCARWKMSCERRWTQPVRWNF